jgi:hypothetical protein
MITLGIVEAENPVPSEPEEAEVQADLAPRTDHSNSGRECESRESRLQPVLVAGMRTSTIEALPMKMETGTYRLRS